MTGQGVQFIRKTVGLGILFLAALAIHGCSSPPSSVANTRTVTIWGVPTGPDSKDFEAVKDAFEKLHPDIKLRVLSMGAGGMNNQKLMTAIVGNVAPDIVNQDRFEISDWASRGAFLPLDPLMKRDASDPLTPIASDYYSAPWIEATYQDHVYGIPTGADNRILYYNKTLFQKDAAKLRAAGLDPNRPPRTWSELLAYSKVLTEFNSDGTIKVAGYIPNGGNSWLYLYAFQNLAPFMSADLTKCTLASIYVQQALEFMKQGYDILGGYEKDQQFESGFQGNENDPFILGKIAMKVDGDWVDDGIARYGPSLDFGVGPAPVPDDRFYHRGRFAQVKNTFITWFGGFCYSIPRNAKNVDDAWTFIKFATSLKGWEIADRAQQRWNQSKGRIFIPRQLANRVANEMQSKLFKPADPRFQASIAMHEYMAEFGEVRPPTVVGNQLWQAQVKAQDTALRGKMSIKAALLQGQSEVQRDLDAFLHEHQYPIIDLNIAGIISVVLTIVGVIVFAVWFKRLKIGRLDRTEAKWAYLFISPWVIGFFVFTLGPMVASLLFSFTEWNVLTPAHFYYLNNYRNLFTSGWPDLSKAFYDAGYLGLFGVPLGLATGLAVAILLNAAVRGMRFYRTAFYLPAIVPLVASVVLWHWLLTPDPGQGILNALWHSTLEKWMGLPMPGWFTSEGWAKPSLIFMGLWGAGSGMILWLAGLKGVPNTLYEAADLDGASSSKVFWNITMPMLSPIVFFNAVMGVIGAVQIFVQVFVLRDPNGPVGPANSLLVPVYYLFDQGFSYFKMGYASSIAWVIFFVIFVLTWVQFKVAPKWVHYEADK